MNIRWRIEREVMRKMEVKKEKSPQAPDLKNFLELFFPTDAWIEIRVRDIKQNRWSNDFLHTDYISYDEKIKVLMDFKKDRDIYFGVGARKRHGGCTKEDVLYLKACFVDIDEKDPEKKRKKIEELKTWFKPPTIIVDSGGGLHAYWMLKEPAYEQDFQRIVAVNRGLAQEFGGDRAVASDIARILRLPGTLNHKYDPPRTVRILHFDPQALYDLTDLEDFAIKIEQYDKSTRYKPKNAPLPEYVEQAVEECAFLRYCRDYAKELPEPYWYAMISNLAFANADELAHKLSEPYEKDGKRYSYEETQKKLKHARDDSPGPHSCEYIRTTLGFQGCESCPWRGKVRAPIAIAYKLAKPNPFESAVDKKGKIKWRALIHAFLDLEFVQKIYKETDETGRFISFYIWNGQYFKRVDENFIMTKLYEISQKYDLDLIHEDLKQVVETMKIATEIREVPKRQVFGVPVKNGILVPYRKIGDVIEFKLKPHDPSHGNKYILPVCYSKNAECNRWMQFLEEVVPDEESRSLLQEFVGAMLVPNSVLNPQKTVILVGRGRNGKSTFANTIAWLIGKENIASLRFDELHGFKLSLLVGKIANIASEITTGKFVETAVWKQLISGDWIVVNRKYKDPIIYRAEAKHLYTVNDLPRVADTSEGFFRRVIIVPFPVQIPEEKIDPFLEKELVKELSGILLWALQGLERVWVNRGMLTLTENVKRHVEEYRYEQNPVMMWLEEEVEPAEEAVTPVDNLYKNFKNWTRENGYGLMSKTHFARELRNVIEEVGLNVEFTRAYVDGDRKRVVKGLKLKMT